MTPKRSESIDYTSECTVCIDYDAGGLTQRVVYERPQMQLPDRQLTAGDVTELSKYQTDATLTDEARAIFSDMQGRGLIAADATLGRIFIARTASAALEMDL